MGHFVLMSCFVIVWPVMKTLPVGPITSSSAPSSSSNNSQHRTDKTFPTNENRYRGNGEILRREEFEARKEAAEIARQQKANKKPKKLASAGKELDDFPLLKVRGMKA